MGRLWHSLAATIVALASLALAFPAHAQSPKLEAAYVVLGPQGAVARAVLAEGSACPATTIDGTQRPMSVRAQPDARFRVLVCEALIPPTAAAASLADRPLPVPKRTLAAIAAFGDTGCHLKSSKLSGKGKDADDDESGGKFQECDNPSKWPFAQLAASVAAAKPDLVIHVGDYLRQHHCSD
jgi:hypothetical protein